MLTDYHSILLHAVAALDPDTASARGAIYDRARRVLIERLRGKSPALPEPAIAAERSVLEAAIDRVEAEHALQESVASRGSRGRRETPALSPSANRHDEGVPWPPRKLFVPILLSVLCALAVLVIGGLSYEYLAGQSTGGSRT
jgi:hypothetical protein